MTPSFMAFSPSQGFGLRASPHFSPGGTIMAQDFSLQRVLATEERSGIYG
jgi:hypothetical protein